MFARIKSKLACLMLFFCLAPLMTVHAQKTALFHFNSSSLAHDTIAKVLGWAASTNRCGGYYLDQPIQYPLEVIKNKSVAITSKEGIYAQYGTSILEKQVTVTRLGQQITANKAYLYRDPETGKISAIDMMGNVHLYEPNTLIVGKKVHYNFDTHAKSLSDIYYRTAILTGKAALDQISNTETKNRKNNVTSLSAWGKAQALSSTLPNIYELFNSSFSTCPPIHPAWEVKASHIVLNKNTGRGYAKHARILLKDMPILYLPYISFSIDRQRKTGFLWPTIGESSGTRQWGPYFLAPFYWNIAPNYDFTFTPGILTKRGVQLNHNFRYLSEKSRGNLDFNIIPNDRLFNDLKKKALENPLSVNPASQPQNITDAEINRLLNASSTRSGFFWRDDTRFNDNWSTHVDINYASDDYYLRNFGNNLNEITQNQLLQEADLFYKGPNWNFLGRLQSYQTLHPVDESPVLNQYRRFPQLLLSGDYPNQKYGFEYFVNTEVTHFDILRNPGSTTTYPIGNRMHLQPGISLPIYRPEFFMTPRFQLALTDYNLQQVNAMNAPRSKHRSIPIFDFASGLNFTRDIGLFGIGFRQTLEPQIYYTYIPYRNQSSIPLFDTTVNTLTYDQIFNYNRFSGIDRIGDANQLGWGVTTRLIEPLSGLEKVRLGLGQIIYFSNRRVTLCNDNNTCTDNPFNPSNHWRVSPLSGLFNYAINPVWNYSANVIWNTTTKQLDNTTINFHYQPDDKRIINLGYSFVRNGDILSGIVVDSSANNIKITDFSFAWPITQDVSVVGRWSQDWSSNHFQNLLYGLQYDTCCWAVRLVGGRAFTNLANNRPQYNNELYIQFALKGLGNISSGNPSGLLSSISGYTTQFGQDL